MAHIAADAASLFGVGNAPAATGRWVRWGGLLLGFGASLFAVGGRWDVALAAWIAPILLLRFSRTSGFWTAVSMMVLASFGQALFWAFQLADAMGPANYAIALTFGAAFAVPYLIDRILAPRLGMVGSLAVLPAAWVCTEFVMCTLSPMGGMYGLRANTQTENLPLLQLTSVLGPYSIGMLIAWLATTVNWVWAHPRDPKVRAVSASFAIALLLVLLGGALRMAFTPPAKDYVRAATVTPSMYVQNLARARIEGIAVPAGAVRDPRHVLFASTSLFASREELARANPQTVRTAYGMVQDDLLRSTREAARSGAKVVLWSETAAPLFSEADTPALLGKVAEVARAEKIFVVASVGQPFARNQTYLIGPDGKPAWSYDKRHPVPLLEPVPAGDAPAPVARTPFGRLSSIICFDADFPSQARVDADIMLVPGLEWPKIGPSHTLKWVRVRAIENGYSLIRAAYFSQAAAFDRLGNVLATQDTSGPEGHIMYADLPTDGRRTIYNAVGDVLVWLSGLALAVAAVLAFRSRRQT